ncbi:hypothetical protein DEJ50_31020 [Streptomyces venezuelae]|uniref:Uncharacterized protein n=1 Tax=Streptomyces venezuelae TaxID=54571 RepID=A0A5P2D944_STRVZ|nr:hypothetical protein [Streptomyces venezuelae]QES51625.1 hypothetical protein DEJ50_31020 [Streptomyces venezuelae]
MPARIPGILAALVLAAGGFVLAAPAAQADQQACEQYVAQHVGKDTADLKDAARQACYEGQIGNQTSCTASLQQAGVSRATSDEACGQAPK